MPNIVGNIGNNLTAIGPYKNVEVFKEIDDKNL